MRAVTGKRHGFALMLALCITMPLFAKAQQPSPSAPRSVPFGKAPFLDYTIWRREEGFKDNNIWFVCRPPTCPTSETIMFSVTESESHAKSERDIRSGTVKNEDFVKLVNELNQSNKVRNDYKVEFLSMEISKTWNDANKNVWIDKITRNILRNEVTYSIIRTYYMGEKAVSISVSAGSLEKARRNLDVAVAGVRILAKPPQPRTATPVSSTTTGTKTRPVANATPQPLPPIGTAPKP